MDGTEKKEEKDWGGYLVARVTGVRFGTPTEGFKFVAELEIFDQKGKRGELLIPYGEEMHIGKPYKFMLKLEEITLDEFMEGGPWTPPTVEKIGKHPFAV